MAKSQATAKNLSPSDEPIWWGLFSAGGVCFAVFIPSLIVFLGLLMPLGFIKLSYAQASAYFFSFWGLVFIGLGIILPTFHSLHRIRHALYDLKCAQKNLIKWLSMGLAALISLSSLIIWL